ncbi:MAG: glycosyl hydrolase family 16, partial [Bacteroidia bacterium]|nr:glycosyl hydrolase family 16 [Bacteroidia bacterium]
MKNIKFHYSVAALLVLLTLAVGCERNLEELPLATNYDTTADVFIDGFSAGLDYAAWGKVTNFSLDYVEKYSGTASMKFEVPNTGDPFGSTAGGVFQAAAGRDLSGYNVLTFWAKASETDTLSTLGFGNSTVKGVDNATYKV